MSTPVLSPIRLDLRAAYKEMLLIRRFEEGLLDLRGTEITGSMHVCLGQEAIAVGTRSGLRDGDGVVATYRGHDSALAWGLPLDQVFAEICGRESGINGGRAGSAYMSDPASGFMGENSIVGAGLPIGDGIALAAQLQGADYVLRRRRH
jgi:2-oxoisovalerate dehydrogenase E1 component